MSKIQTILIFLLLTAFVLVKAKSQETSTSETNALGFIYLSKDNSIYNGIKLNIYDNELDRKQINGVSLSLLSSQYYTNNGLGISMLYSYYRKCRGVSFSLVNECFEMHGVQLGLINKTKKINGVRIGLLNLYARVRCDGFCFKTNGVSIGIINTEQQIKGCQFGILNSCNLLQGFQIGLLNINRSEANPWAEPDKSEKGIQIGLLNYDANRERFFRILPLLGISFKKKEMATTTNTKQDVMR